MKTEITFWKDNLITGEHKRSVESIIKDFIGTPHQISHEEGWPFERAMLVHLMDYGSFDQISDQQWDELSEEYSRQR